MSLGGIVLGIINIAIVVAILLLIGAIILWFCSWMGIAVPGNVQKGYIAVVALIALYMIVALLLGIPSVRIIGHGQSNYPAVGAVMPPAPAIMREN
jgi:MFS superfamily sulfate permease-like transporter